jgi:ribonucleoside-diphosphate reductase alpha chain
MGNMSEFAKTILDRTYAHDVEDENRKETWDEIAYRVTKHVMKSVGVNMRNKLAQDIFTAIKERKFIPAGRYLYASGNAMHQTNNCVALKAHDSREGWAELLSKSSMALMTGAGIGVEYSDIRAEGSIIRRTGGVASGPITLMQIVNECGRGIFQGGNRRSALWAGLRWDHPDIHRYIRIKNWPPEIHAMKAKDFSFPAVLDNTNISVQLNDEFFEAYTEDEHPKHSLAQGVYWSVIEQMLKTGEPGFTVDTGKNAGETLRNACGEFSSRYRDNICNLGSLNFARIESLEEVAKITELAIAFLLAGSVYSDVPYSDVGRVRDEHRQLGLGVMGIHEWLLKRGKIYAPDEELGRWLAAYAKSGRYANKWADEWSLSHPKKTRAIAPNGTTAIVAETSGGIEPLYCVAYKRRYLKGDQQYYQYVIDPCAKRLIAGGIDPDMIEDAYTLAQTPERRVAFQAWIQTYVDHCISSTINLPAWGTEFNNQDLLRSFGSMLMRYLPTLRGITCYPDGSRSGQPLTPVLYLDAVAKEGYEVIEEQANVCSLRGGSCGD